MTKKTVIRRGDTVKVIRCNFVRRVGYPLVWYDIKDEVAQDPRTQAAWKALTDQHVPSGGSLGELFIPETPAHYDDFIKLVAKMRVSERDFGGRERSLHYRAVDPNLPATHLWQICADVDTPVPDVTGMLFTVWDKRVKYTGTWHPSWSDHEDYWPAGLNDKKARVLLSLEPGEIEDVDVELVERTSEYLK